MRSDNHLVLNMGAKATSIAVIDDAGRVVTFVRLDAPDGWAPPQGTTAIPDDELPAGWEWAADSSPVPPQVSARQIRLWLVRNGIPLATVEAAIDSITDQPTRDSVRVEWEYAPYVERSHPLLAPLASALGLDEVAVDAAFREAAAL
jgi:hypothetical protein